MSLPFNLKIERQITRLSVVWNGLKLAMNIKEIFIKLNNKSWLPVILMLCGIVLFFSTHISSKTTPGGDGQRIYPKALSIAVMDSQFPVWNPYRGGGVPLLASPEHFGWVGRLVDMTGSQAIRNIGINSLLVLSIMLFAFGCYILAREFDLSKPASALTGYVSASSYFMWEFFFTGRINTIVSLILLIYALFLYVRYIKTKLLKYFILSGFLISGTWYISAYYGIVTILPVFFLVGLYFNVLHNIGFASSIFRTLFQNSGLYVLGALFIMPLLLPLLDYTLTSVLTVNTSKSYSQLHNYIPKIPGSILNLFFMNDPEMRIHSTFPFLSFISLPLITVLFCARNLTLYKYRTYLWVILILLNLLILCGRIHPFAYVITFFESTPLLHYIRWGYSFQFTLLLALSFLTGMGYDTLKEVENKTTYLKYFLPVLGVIFIVIVSMGFDLLWVNFDYTAFINQSFVFNSSLLDSRSFLICIALAAFPVTALNKRSIGSCVVVFVVIQMSFLKPVSYIPESSRSENVSTFKGNVNRYLLHDTSYYSVVKLDDRGKHTYLKYVIGLPKKRSGLCT